MTARAATPVTLIGGYLGAGKTTLVNHVLRQATPRRLAVLVNEFGELPIDADLIEAQDGDIISLSGGCVCCSYGNDLVSALMDVLALDPAPEHILLEASGVAIPGAIASSLTLLGEVSLDGIVVLADAETVRQRADDKYMGDTVARQLADADLVFLNKADLVSAARLAATRDWLIGQAPRAVVVETRHAQAPVSAVLRGFEPHPGAEGAHPGHADDCFQTARLALDGPLDPHELAQQLIDDDPHLLRAKGFVVDLQGRLQTLQIVGKRVAVSAAPARAQPGLVTIRAGRAGET